MRLSLVAGVIGKMVRLFSLALLPPLALALFDRQWGPALHFAAALALAGLGGSLLGRLYKPAPMFQRSEALAVVAGTWLAVGHVGAIPLALAGLSPVDAMFESLSGFTTTGATVLQNFDDFDRSFFLWRAMIQWFGGLGVIALFVVILPRLGIAGRQLFFAEASGTSNEALAPQVRRGAMRLWVLYVLLTLAQILLLTLWAGMPLFDSLCNSLATLAAGGFSPHGLSIAGYQNPLAEWIFVGFMILGGASFSLQWKAFTSRPLALIRDGEFLCYVSAAALGAVGVAVVLSGGIPTLETLRLGAFQSASLISSTGFASVDYNRWNDVAKAILVGVMLVGGCAGSAAGGAKVIRYILVAKFLRRELKQVLHPRAVIPIRYGRREVPDGIVNAVVTMVVLYLATIVGIGLIVVMIGADFVTGFSAALACVGNIGPGFGLVGPMDNYAHLPTLTKVILTIGMWIGRLEIVTVLALLHPDVWRNLHWRGR